MPEQPPINVPPPFPGASQLLIDTHAPLVKVTELPTDLEAELIYRRLLDGYLRLYVREATHQSQIWDKAVLQAGDNLVERNQALAQVRSFRKLLRANRLAAHNRTAMTRLQAALRRLMNAADNAGKRSIDPA